MKTTLKNIKYLFVIFAIALSATTLAQGNKIKVSDMKVVQENDLINISMRMSADPATVGKNETVQIIPVIQGPNGNTELPGIVFNGKRRAGFYEREQNINRGVKTAEQTSEWLVTIGSALTTVDYSHSVPVTHSIEGANIYLYQYTYKCGEEMIKRNQGILSEKIYSNRVRPSEPDALQTDFVSFYQPEYEAVKHRETSLKAYLNFRSNSYEILPTFGNNAEELSRINSAVAPITVDRKIYSIKSIEVAGYASPEGRWKHNEQLAYNRANNFWNYIRSGHNLQYIVKSNISINSFSEDWAGLEKMVRESDLTERDKVLGIIDQQGDLDAKEQKIKSLGNGETYKYIFENYYPLLRRIEVSFRYDVRGLNDQEAVEMVEKSPKDLSLYEMYRAYAIKGMKPDQTFLKAVNHFPEDPIAIINASSVHLAMGDMDKAWNYLKKVQDDPRALNNIGLYYMLKGETDKAKEILEKARHSDLENADQNLAQLRQYLSQKEALENYTPVYEYKIAE